MKKNERIYAEPQLISRHLNCTICCEVFRNPHRIDCEYFYLLNIFVEMNLKLVTLFAINAFSNGSR